jgi:hypothetical protein
MIERTIIVILVALAIIFVPYFVGWLLIRPKSIEDYMSRWWIGIIILMFLSLIVIGVKLYIIPYIINGSV